MSGKSLTVARGALLPALALVTRAIERRNTIPVLGNVLLRAGDGCLTLVGTDLDAELSTSIACSASAAFETTLPATNLHDIVRKLPEGMEVTLTGDDTVWTVSGGRSRFRLPCLPASDFMEMSGGVFDNLFTLPASVTASMIDATKASISSEETRYYLNGIHLHADEDAGISQLVAVTTDGHRLSKFPMAMPDGATGLPPIIIPRKAVELISKLLPEKGDVSVSVSQTKIRVSIDTGTALTSKLIDGTYPDYRRVVPTANANRYLVDRLALHAAIDRVVTISTQKGSAVKFGFADGELKLSANNPDAGSAEETVSVEMLSGEPVEVGFNGRYCLDMLASATTENIEFALGDSGAPALVRPVTQTETGQFFVIMPMRV